MSFDPISAGLNLVNKVADKFFVDADDKAKFALEAKAMVLNGELTEFVEEIQAKTKIIIAEAQGSFLQRNWRPMLMCLFGIIIANNYIVYPYLALFFAKAPKMDIPPDMWALLKIGVGGYVMGRTVEKGIKEYKK